MTAIPQIGRAACVNPEAEFAFLGGLMMNAALIRSLGVDLKPDHFSDANCQRLYSVIREMVERGELVSHPTILPYLCADEHDQQPVSRWLATVAMHGCEGGSVGSYARHIVDLAQRREVGAICAEVSARALNPDPAVSAQSIIEDAESKLRGLADMGCNQDARLKQVGKVAHNVIARVEAIQKGGIKPGISTGFSDLDRRLGGGLYPSALYLLAGRPSMGKSALGMMLARNIAASGTATAAFTLEMSDEEVVTRLIGAETGIPYEDIRRAHGITQRQGDDLVKARNTLDRIPLHIADKAALSVSAMRSEILRLSARHPIGAVVVDYLQLMTSSERYQGNRVQQISEISAGLKTLAKDLKVPVLALSQLSREVEKRPDKRPQLSDLRESGAIEQDADVVMFVYREEYYLERDPKDSSDPDFLEWHRKLEAAKNRCDILIQKNRHGAVGDISLFFDTATGRFGNWGGGNG